jgi:hypothetical protein
MSGAVRLMFDLTWFDDPDDAGSFGTDELCCVCDDKAVFDMARIDDDGVVAGWQPASAIIVTAAISPFVCRQQK